MDFLKTVYLSLCLHIALVILLSIIRLPEKPPQKDLVEFNVIEKLQPTQVTPPGQIVRQSFVPDTLLTEKTDDQVRFLSERSQRVLKQSQALVKGMTENRGEKTAVNSEKSAPEPNAIEKHAMDLKATQKNESVWVSPGQKTISEVAREQLMNQNQYDFGRKGISTVGETLPNEVSVGSFTSLNTDRYLFYSFYSRVEELIRFRWESMVKYTMANTSESMLRRNAQNKWTTEIEIWLKPSGEYHSAHLMKGAGLKNLDAAAQTSFQQARLFPNPPKEMVESDGLIHLRYSFTVYYDPKLMVRE